MKIYAYGEAQNLNIPGEFLETQPLARVIGIANLGSNNADNQYGWNGIKAVIHIEGMNYILDFPERFKIETNDGIVILEGLYGDPQCWSPTIDDCGRYDLYYFDLTY